MMKERKKQRKLLIVVTSVVLTAILGVGVFFFFFSVYDNGVNAGHQSAMNEVSEKLTQLVQAIKEKATLQKSIEDNLTDLPEKIDSETVDQYIEAINNLTQNTTNEQIKSLLRNYSDQWREFKNIYDSKDNEKITESFDALKNTAKETASQIKSQCDAAIKTAVDSL